MPGVSELFAEELGRGIAIFVGDRRDVVHRDLEPSERNAVNKVFDYGLAQLRRVAPKVAADIEPQRSLAIKVAGIFKEMIPEKKSFTFPSETGSLGVAWLFPQAVKYTATTPTSYNVDSWDIPLTAGTASFIFGSATDFYRTSGTTGQHSAILVFQNGLIEIGSTPKVEQFQLVAEGLTKYGIYTVAPIVEERIEENRLIYQYPMPMGAIPIFWDKGVRWSFMPRASGTATLKLLGLVFYEHDFASTLKWV
jgi:hypothetical protein